MFSGKLDAKMKKRVKEVERKALQPLVNMLLLERLCSALSATLSTTLIINQRHANYIELYC